MANQEHSIGDAFDNLSGYLGNALTSRVNALESHFRGACDQNVEGLLKNQQLTSHLFSQALSIKRATGQLDVVIHALGVLLSLPAVLENGEVIERLSLGAGNAPGRCRSSILLPIRPHTPLKHYPRPFDGWIRRTQKTALFQQSSQDADPFRIERLFANGPTCRSPLLIRLQQANTSKSKPLS